MIFVDGKLFLIRGGEVHNSSSCRLDYMEREVWPFVRDLHLNTLLVPVAWETVEAKEGVYDFSVPEGLLGQARREGMKLVFLWFGLWKNGESTYVPSWVKRDSEKYFRARYRGGLASQTISPLCEEAVQADARAFSAFMRFLHQADGEEHTVLLVQVENEIGFLGSDRDYSAEAEEWFAQRVPQAVAEQFGGEGTWKDVFGREAGEMFMAYYYAAAVEQIAAAGKRVYDLPMYVNAWLNQFPDVPGNYPSGGPIARNVPVWKTVVQSIDIFAPDIYLSDFDGVCREYTFTGNPLFIPEARRDPVTASNAFYAFGKYNALGFSPFGIEDFIRNTGNPDAALLERLQIDVSAFTCIDTGKYLRKTYEILEQTEELYLECRDRGRIHAFIRRNEHERGCILPLEGCDLELIYRPKGWEKPGCAGMVLESGEGEFYIAGCNVEIRLLPATGSNDLITLISMEEGRFQNGKWETARVLNGDERGFSKLGEYAEVKHYTYCRTGC